MTLRNVALVRAGTWQASKGKNTISVDDLDAIVAAAGDKLIDHTPIKIGHDPTNAFNSALSDGEPAYGWVENLSRGDGSTDRPDADTLYGDVVGMPAKLEEVAPKAFRRRSVEIAWQVKSAAGKVYPAVLTALSLLGVRAPAVKGLDDVLALYADLTSADDLSVLELVDGLDADQTAAFSQAITALAAIDTAVLPPQASGRQDGDTGTQQTTRPEQGTQEGTRMTSITKAAVEKALAEAGDADVSALLEDLLKQTRDEQTSTEPTGGAAAAAVEVEATAASAATDDTVTISRATFTQLSQGAAAGMTAAQQLDQQRRDQIIVTALSEGRITPAEQTVFRTQLDKDEEGTVTLLAALQPRFSTVEHGHAGTGATTSSELAESELAEFDAWSDRTFGTSLTAK